ncbi:ATP-dependent nuclease subunit B [Bifidobacterium saguini DSM 23967]|uniref:ATP-dependent nuclease subunit B n=2 Tax=Bifidobacterium saguini TaxID=762210 RepID=A0A087DCS6_9BIFI|nr:PD-(D/E)XK nuclease family protein [Bifidobacterium saguini]KFI93326.1 ATP-dependent nuclease subunit B [Bifidobacterium saguini DSM 23967]QTB90539.1 PD-(D/E)XK nuclease family protein [Bifidobacterium saguini]
MTSALKSLLERMLSGNTAPSCRHIVVLTPARLRSYAERETLRFMRGREPQQHEVEVSVHSFISFVRSVIGNHDDAASMRPTLSPFLMRALLAQEMGNRPDLFREAGRTFGSVNQFAAQIEELRKSGVDSDDLLAAAHQHARSRTSSDADRFQALHSLMELVEHEYADDYALPGEIAPVMKSWLAAHGSAYRFGLYGFENIAPSEALALQWIERYSRLDCDADVSEVPYGDLLRVLEGSSTDSPRTLASVRPVNGVPVVIQAIDNPAEEIRFVAADIVRRVKEAHGKLSYGDVLVAARDMSPYRALLDTEFSYRSVPVNTTPAAMMSDDPLADVVLGLLDPAFYRREPAAMMRVFRSGLMRAVTIDYKDYETGAVKRRPISRSTLDKLENLLITQNPRTIWQDAKEDSANLAPEWQAARVIKACIDQAEHQYGLRACAHYQGNDGGSTATVRDQIRSLVQFLIDMKVNKAVWNTGAESGKSNERRINRTRQVWDTVMGALNEMVQQFGDEPFSVFAPTFKNNLESLLCSEPLGARPKALNAVDVVTFPTPMRQYRLVYVLGASESQLPAIPHEGGLLDESERYLLADVLTGRGKKVAAWSILRSTLDAKSQREPLAFNMLTTHASDALIVTWPKTLDGAAQQPSSYVNAIAPHASDAQDEANAAVGQWRHDIEDRLIDLPDQANPLDRELATLLFTKSQGSDSDNAATESRVFDASVSSIEQYYCNPYDYFLERGLKIKPLRPYQLDPILEGVFYHAVLEHAVGRWAAEHPGEAPELHQMQAYIRDYARLDRHDAAQDDRWSVLEEDPRMSVLDSSERMRMVHQQLTYTLLNMAAYMDGIRAAWCTEGKLRQEPPKDTENKKKSKKTKPVPISAHRIVPLHTERKFGTISGKPGKWEALTDGYLNGIVNGQAISIPLHVNGKVDRIDKVIASNGETDTEGLLVLDYKSSAHQLFGAKSTGDKPDDKGSAIHYGRELQLFTYARAAQRNADVPIIGLCFVPIRRKGADTDAIAFNDWGSKKTQGTLSDGVMTLFQDDAWASSWTMQLGGGSTIVKPWKTAKPEIWAQIESDEFNAICDFVQFKIQEACENIMAGSLPVHPFKTLGPKVKDGVSNNPYADVIALDMLDGQAFHYEDQISKDSLINTAMTLAQRKK